VIATLHMNSFAIVPARIACFVSSGYYQIPLSWRSAYCVHVPGIIDRNVRAKYPSVGTIGRNGVNGGQRIRGAHRPPPTDDVSVVVVMRRLYQDQLEAPRRGIMQHFVRDSFLRRCRAIEDGRYTNTPWGQAKATFVTRLQPSQSPGRAARQLPEQSTIFCVESSSTDVSRLRAARP
jgi:hypothetical protein